MGHCFWHQTQTDSDGRRRRTYKLEERAREVVCVRERMRSCEREDKSERRESDSSLCLRFGGGT